MVSSIYGRNAERRKLALAAWRHPARLLSIMRRLGTAADDAANTPIALAKQQTSAGLHRRPDLLPDELVQNLPYSRVLAQKTPLEVLRTKKLDPNFVDPETAQRVRQTFSDMLSSLKGTHTSGELAGVSTREIVRRAAQSNAKQVRPKFHLPQSYKRDVTEFGLPKPPSQNKFIRLTEDLAAKLRLRKKQDNLVYRGTTMPSPTETFGRPFLHGSANPSAASSYGAEFWRAIPGKPGSVTDLRRVVDVYKAAPRQKSYSDWTLDHFVPDDLLRYTDANKPAKLVDFSAKRNVARSNFQGRGYGLQKGYETPIRPKRNQFVGRLLYDDYASNSPASLVKPGTLTDRMIRDQLVSVGRAAGNR